ncbi:GNAT family N-acetyltransferase [Aporhodopirellula aestuarii]|uniref:N-acetyltransferase domain-containing protein n=1 Tax=Aporhodopirellula aestuarii TaxID=2950107 RepID=A0ABT0U3K8_9BACT|nr:hypothetical protein [Aporhodopirellula aestuarii]MCM2371477.1 hypothetical protein [Aporhodopirellula aestuarii]
MAIIRPFQNSDLPGVFEVWIRHWLAARQTPPVSVSILERALMSRSFFRPADLIVGLADGRVIAWTHVFRDPPVSDSANGEGSEEGESSTATIAALCFADEPGLAICDQMLKAAEEYLRADGVQQIFVGAVRDDVNGYAGLAPVGHGIGIPVSDARTGSLLSRNGYQVSRTIERMVVQTSTYRPPVNRSFLQLRRSTRLDHVPVLPSSPRVASAMSHFDIERYMLVDYQQQQTLAMCGLWMGDPEVQVMESSKAILSLTLLDAHTYNGLPVQIEPNLEEESGAIELTTEQQFLIASLVQSLSNRQIFSVETAIDRDDQKLLTQLDELKFERIEQGKQWVKKFS